MMRRRRRKRKRGGEGGRERPSIQVVCIDAELRGGPLEKGPLIRHIGPISDRYSPSECELKWLIIGWEEEGERR